MTANQPPWPREWLMTDERIGDRLWEAVERLPSSAGVVFRHYATPQERRVVLARRVADMCRDRGLTLAVARDALLAASLGAELVHNPAGAQSGLPVSRSAHSLEEARSACMAGAVLLFVSPIHETSSHPGQPGLGHHKAVEIARSCPVPAIALGGVSRTNFSALERDGFYGWAGIDAWLGGIRT